METIVRVTNITIKNFKNVVEGTVSLVNTRKPYKSSILGVYGQNGSGKTALIDSLELLKYALCGAEIPSKFADYINVESDCAEIEYSFDVELEGVAHPVIFVLKIARVIKSADVNTDDTVSESKELSLAVKCEQVKCQMKTPSGKMRMGTLIDTDTPEVFVPRAKYKTLVSGTKAEATDLLVAKIIAQKTSRSFVFSKELLGAIRTNVVKSAGDNSDFEELSRQHALLEALVKFGNTELFVINTSNSGLISLNAQPLVFKMSGKKNGSLGTIALPIDEPSTIPEDMYKVTVDVIDNMNIVLKQIIPGLTVAVKDLGNQIMPDGTTGTRIALVSKKNNREIALKYESEGIKKIVSILQLLVVVYNQKSITVAIDELDAGVFEYLLGELLKIISEKGKGQLIFTSHNLRPLETIDRGFVAFTTTNPSNRYIRMTNVKDNNNLRDYYYRDIMLGEQSEEVYEVTNNSEIALAFREAGEYIGS